MMANVPLEQLHLAWPVLAPFLQHTLDDEQAVLQALKTEHAQLWAIVEDGQPIAAVVTQITLEPEKRCLVWKIGGSRARAWVGDFLNKIEAWAKAWGCVALWGVGRPGWARIVESNGFERIEDFDGKAAWQRRIV